MKTWYLIKEGVKVASWHQDEKPTMAATKGEVLEVSHVWTGAVDHPSDYVPEVHKVTVTESKYYGKWRILHTVTLKTEAELIADEEAKADAADSELNTIQIKAAALRSMTFDEDEEMLDFATLFPAWRPGIAVKVNEVVQYDGQIYKVIQAHTTQLDWYPSIVPALFVQVAAPGVIPDWVQPTGAHDAYNIGDQVIFEGQVWESLINANTWSPTDYPAGWQLMT